MPYFKVLGQPEVHYRFYSKNLQGTSGSSRNLKLGTKESLITYVAKKIRNSLCTFFYYIKIEVLNFYSTVGPRTVLFDIKFLRKTILIANGQQTEAIRISFFSLMYGTIKINVYTNTPLS